MKRLTNRQDASTKCWEKESRDSEVWKGRLACPGGSGAGGSQQPHGPPAARAWTCPVTGASVGHGAEHGAEQC